MVRPTRTHLFAAALIALTALRSTQAAEPVRIDRPAARQQQTRDLFSAETLPQRPSVRRAAPATSTPFAAILGAVKFPGAYEIPAAPSSIMELVEHAGANVGEIAAIRVFGKQTTFLSAETARTTRIAAGDVLLVVNNGAETQAIPTDPATLPTDTFQVAVVGLLDRPAVLNLQGDALRVSTVFARLRQPEALTQAMEIYRGFGPRLLSDVALKSGDVLFVDRTIADSAKAAESELIPESIPLVPVEASVSTQTGPIESFTSAFTSDVPASTVSLPVMPPQDELTSRAAELNALLEGPPPEQRTAALPEPPQEFPAPEIVSLPAPEPEEIIQTAAAPAVLPAVPAKVEPTQRPIESVTPSESVSITRSKPSRQPNVDRNDRLSWLVPGVVALSVLFAWVIAISNRQALIFKLPAPVEESAPLPVVQTDSFTDLIHDRLPMELEAVQLPRGEFHGAVVALGRLAVHQPHAVAAPHFAAAPAPMTETVADKLPVSEPSTIERRKAGIVEDFPAEERIEPRRVAEMHRPAKRQVGVLERVLVARHRGANR
jgi:hypothetical protein